MPAEDGSRSKLSLHSSNQDKSNEKISIYIKKCKNLQTSKAEGLTLYIKLDYNETTIAESSKIHLTPENVPDFNFNASLLVNMANEQNSLDDLAHKPLIVTLIEVLPKEKKQKEEKVQHFGQCTFDFLPLLRGEKDVSFRAPIFATPGSTFESYPADQPQPELEIKYSIDQPLLADEDLAKTNLLNVTIESIYSVPDAWNTNAKESAYTIAMPMPNVDERDYPIVFTNGLQKAPTDQATKQRRWADTRGIQATNAVFSQHVVPPDDPNGEENGDFQSKEDKEFRALAEKEKSRITWNIERNCYISGRSHQHYKNQVLNARYWPLEVIRTSVPTGAKGKKDDDLGLSFHGVVYVDMAPLLYPGALSIRGAYKLHPYVESTYKQNTKGRGSILDETLKNLNTLYDRNFVMSPIKKDPKGADKKDPKKVKDSATDGHDQMATSVQQVIDAKPFVVLEIKFEKPLVPRKPFETLVERVSELIPPRPKYPLKTNSSEKAIQDYHSQIKSIVDSVLDDYRNLSLDDAADAGHHLDAHDSRNESEYETRRRKLLYELNSSGKYFAFKEQLKNSVVKIVREKFLRTSAFTDQMQMEQFLSELYVFLIDELHKTLNEMMNVEEVPASEYAFNDTKQMKHFALEAEMNRNFDLAAYYYQERIAREKDNFSFWFDYSIFNLLIEEKARCEECLKECISINQHDMNGLLLYSVICAMQEKYDESEIFLERVTAQENENVIAWTLYGVLYEQKGQELNADITFKRAVKLNNVQYMEMLPIAQPAENIGGEEEAAGGGKKDDAAEIIDDSKLLDLQSKSRSSKRGTITAQTKTKSDSFSKSPKSPQGNAPATAATAYPKQEEQIMTLKERQHLADLAINKSIYLKTANFLVNNNAFSWAEKLLAKELVNPNGGPSCYYHILLAKIKLAKNQLTEAELACSEALKFDYQNYEAWILWSHVRYLSGDFVGAKEKYERVLLFNELPQDQTHAIYIRLASIYLKEDNYEDAKKLFLFPCKNSPSCMSWLGVGICCYRLDQLEEAKNALCEANILNNKAPEVWAYLSLICLKTNKPLEAEQAYKYAIKLSLDNPELLEEIHMMQETVGFGNPEF